MPHKGQYALLNVEEMARADQITIDSGISGSDLMESAGLSVSRHILHHFNCEKTIVLCGPGNNGGDGFVIARHLKDAGWDVDVSLLGNIENLSGDAAIMAEKWPDDIIPFGPDIISDHKLVVDALFGAGLCRPIEGNVAQLIGHINSLKIPVIAVDVPTGIDGNSGQALGAAIHATSTITFFRRKPGHILFPGRKYCGNVEVTDIGILKRVIDEIVPKTYQNNPSLWREKLPRLKMNIHKYHRGHAVVVGGGDANAGAACLAAKASLRIGAGLVSVACSQDAVNSYASQLMAVMIKPFPAKQGLDTLLQDNRLNVWCIGPGNGVTSQTRDNVLKILAKGRQCVIDADGLSVFESNPEALFMALKASNLDHILTPHEGEFSKLYPDLSPDKSGYNKLESARQAALRAGAVIILKGPDTVVASPDGRAVINDNAPPSLATAGSGDVLSGLCLGLISQGMTAFDAACAAVWIHGAAAKSFGPGLISEDIEGEIPAVLKKLATEE